MNKMIAWWAQNPVAANLLMIGIIVAGLFASRGLEREVFPTIRLNWVEIQVPWPGSAPQEVEEQVVIRIEEALADLDNVEHIYSFSTESLGHLFVEANRKVDMAQFTNDIKMRIDSISTFPRDIEQPIVRIYITRNELIRIAVHGTAGERVLKRTAERLRDEIALLPGASIVKLSGARREEVGIELSEQAMRRYGVTFDEVARAIRASSINLSSGAVRTPTGDVMLRARNLADSHVDFEKIIVRQSPGGAVIRVGDVAHVRDGFEDVDMLANFNGEPAVLVDVMTTEEMDVVETSKSVLGWLGDAQARMPDGVNLTLWWDESKVYFDRMATISKSAISGLILVFAVLFLSLRPKVALWTTVGIATAFAGTFMVLPATDVSLNLLSLFAFLLVLGVVVDDAIVVGENIHRKAIDTGGGIKAAILGTQLVAKPVIFAVLTTMLTFLPWLLLSGISVEFTRPIAIIAIAALTFSLIEALFILPSHLAHMHPREKMGVIGRAQKRLADGIVGFAETRYRRFVEGALRQRYLTASIFAFLLIVSIGVLSSGWLKFAFQPEIENERIKLQVTLADGAPYSRSLEVLEQIETAQRRLIAQVNGPGAEGEAGPDGPRRLIENWYTVARKGSVEAEIQLAPPEVRRMPAKEAAEAFRDLIGDIPDAEEVTTDFTINSASPGLQYSVGAESFDELRAAIDDFKTRLHSYDVLYDIHDNLKSATDEIRMTLKPGSEKLGVTLGDVSRQVRQAYFGEEVQRLPREGNDVRVMVRYTIEDRESLASLQDFRVRLADGRAVPLMAVVDIEYAPGLSRIDRRDRRRSAVVSASLKDDIRGEIVKDLDENFFPQWRKAHPDITLRPVGQAEGQGEFMAEIGTLYLIVLFAMYALIAVAFKSYWEPLIIMTAIPFSFMGAVYGHLIFGSTMAIYSWFGIGAAAGVVVNDNLVLVDYINRLRRDGLDFMSAVVTAGVVRFRPIMLTSVTTIIGVAPMLAARSTESEFLKPTVIALAFGVFFATFVTLALVPALYAIGHDVSRASARLRAWAGGTTGGARKDSAIEPGE